MAYNFQQVQFLPHGSINSQSDFILNFSSLVLQNDFLVKTLDLVVALILVFPCVCKIENQILIINKKFHFMSSILQVSFQCWGSFKHWHSTVGRSARGQLVIV